MTCDLTLPLSILAAYLSCSPPQWLKYRIPRCFGTSGLDSSKVHRHTETADFPGLGRKMSKVHFCFQVIGNSNRIPRAQHRQGIESPRNSRMALENQVTWLSAAFIGFQRLSAAFSFQNSWVLSLHVIACHCMSLQSCTCQPNVCGYCSNESGRQCRQYLTCCTGSVPVLDDEMHMGSEFGGDTNGSLVNWGNHNARSHAAKLWQHPKLKESSEI